MSKQEVREAEPAMRMIAAIGAALAIPAALVGAIGLERALTVWNDELGLLPWGLARILGITTYLEIPEVTAWAAATLGAVLVVAGLVLAVPSRRVAPQWWTRRRESNSLGPL